MRQGYWEGVVTSDVLSEKGVKLRHGLSDAAKSFDWSRVFRILEEIPEWVNSPRPDGPSLYAPLHQAAYGGAPREVVERLVEGGAFRTLRTAKGERPVDIARRRGHRHLVGILEPRMVVQVSEGDLKSLRTWFHALVCVRTQGIEKEYVHQLRLPDVEEAQEGTNPVWFAFPGMYGGFSYRFDQEANPPTLVVESWCRVVDGSGQRHRITRDSCELVEEGFV